MQEQFGLLFIQSGGRFIEEEEFRLHSHRAGDFKPALNTITGTAGTVSAPIWATVENIASVVLMALLVVLLQIDPWLLVALFAIVTLVILGVLAYTVYTVFKKSVSAWHHGLITVLAFVAVIGAGDADERLHADRSEGRHCLVEGRNHQVRPSTSHK